jgi:hypothetical protein
MVPTTGSRSDGWPLWRGSPGHAGRLNVTVIADPQRCPDLDDVAAAVEQELQVLTGTASHSAVATAWSGPLLSAATRAGPGAACSTRSAIPRSIFWLITKLTTEVGRTMNPAHRRK